jgi:hypothetical protein
MADFVEDFEMINEADLQFDVADNEDNQSTSTITVEDADSGSICSESTTDSDSDISVGNDMMYLVDDPEIAMFRRLAIRGFQQLEKTIDDYKMTLCLKVASWIGVLMGLQKYQLIPPFCVFVVCIALLLYMIDGYLFIEHEYFINSLSVSVRKFNHMPETYDGGNYPLQNRTQCGFFGTTYGNLSPYYGMIYYKNDRYTFWLFKTNNMDNSTDFVIEIRSNRDAAVLYQCRYTDIPVFH